MLLLFDNFEHVAGAAGGVAALMEAFRGLEVVVTSRERLHLTGEQEYPVPPPAHSEAVAVFAVRARASDPAFEVDGATEEICRRLDDLPLALELAAARVKSLSTALILERLERRLPLLTGGGRDAPARQQTLRATIDWSYELLSPAEKQDCRRVERSLGRAWVRVEGREEFSLLVFGDDALLGAVTLEEVGLAADPVARRLVPVPALMMRFVA